MNLVLNLKENEYDKPLFSEAKLRSKKINIYTTFKTNLSN